MLCESVLMRLNRYGKPSLYKLCMHEQMFITTLDRMDSLITEFDLLTL